MGSRFRARSRSLVLVMVTALGCPLAAEAQEPPAPPVVATPPASTLNRTPQQRWVSPGMARRWHSARVVYGIGGVMGLLGSGLTLSSVLIVAITGYPCNPDDPIVAMNPSDSCNRNSAVFDPPKPTDAAPLLAYIGSSASALGFVFAAAGLGYQHSLLAGMQADPGRGLFAGGTTLGLLGFLSVGASYLFGFTSFLSPYDQGTAILASSITGTALCALGGLLYTIDTSRMKRAWLRLSTF